MIFDMKTTIVVSALLLASIAAAANVPSPEVQTAAAVLAGPAELREGAAVLGYNAQGELVKLREGKNELICLASDPNKTAFSVACYHKDLEPYMARGRELVAQKIVGNERNDVRWKEVAEGKLKLPREPRTLYVLTGKGFDAATGQVIDPYLRWVIYTPYATPASTGRKVRRSSMWTWHPAHPLFACFWNVGSKSAGRKNTPGSSRRFIPSAKVSATTHGAPSSSNGRVVPRPSDTLVPSNNTVPG